MKVVASRTGGVVRVRRRLSRVRGRPPAAPIHIAQKTYDQLRSRPHTSGGAIALRAAARKSVHVQRSLGRATPAFWSRPGL